MDAAAGRPFISRFLILAALALASTLLPRAVVAANLKGEVQGVDGAPVCALAIASGCSMFTCSEPVGQFSFVDLPLERDGTINLQVYARGHFPFVVKLSEFGHQTVVLTRANATGSSGPTNRQKSERLIGEWEFSFIIISEFYDEYSLFGPAAENPEVPGLWQVHGTDTFGDPDVLAGYDEEFDSYALLDLGILFDQLYVFNFLDSDFAAGCNFQVDPLTFEFSYCYRTLAFRTSAGPTVLGTAQASAGPQQTRDREARVLQETELRRQALYSLPAPPLQAAATGSDPAVARSIYRRLKSAQVLR